VLTAENREGVPMRLLHSLSKRKLASQAEVSNCSTH